MSVPSPAAPVEAVRVPWAVRGMVAIALVTAVLTTVVDVANVVAHQRGLVDEAVGGGVGLTVRTIWALLRAVGLVVFAVHAWRGRAGARPLGLVLAVSTVFSVGRLAGAGEWTPVLVALVVGFAAVVVGCLVLVALLAFSPAVRGHLVQRPRRRDVPLWVVTARVCVASYVPLTAVPALVALGTLFGEPRLPQVVAVPLVVGWLVFVVALNGFLPLTTIVLGRGHRWARVLVTAVTVVVLTTVPALCLALLGVEGVLRDAVPLVVAGGLALWGLHGDRGGRAHFTPRGRVRLGDAMRTGARVGARRPARP